MDFEGTGGAIATAPNPIGSATTFPWGVDSLIGSLLGEQGDLTAVERFSRFVEDRGEVAAGLRYESLLPANPPGPGQQLAFEVDLDRCSGCKACVAACHALNGLDEGEAWREVGLLIGGPGSLPVLQHVTSSCHHCLEPACLDACPVEAYEKDPITGIVRHLDDQCIGCRYCTLACPYDAPKYHEAKGIVRKCDLCADRLREGEAPACVSACPHEAIRIRVVNLEEVRDRAEAGSFLPTTFDPSLTKPSTVYRSRAPIGHGPVIAADAYRLEPDHAHFPLVVMLVLTQLAVGGFLFELAHRLATGNSIAGPIVPAICLAFGFAGLAASVLHLGRPQYAYRAVLGLRHSWLSREVLAFGLFAKLSTGFVAVDLIGGLPVLAITMLAGAVGAGLAGVACSVMVYHAVRRPFWNARVSGAKFSGTAVVLGLSVLLASLGLSGDESTTTAMATVALPLATLTVAKLWFEAEGVYRGQTLDREMLLRSRFLIRGPLRRLGLARWLLGLAGGCVLPAATVVALGWGAPAAVAVLAPLAMLTAIGGELAERTLFFQAVSRPKMPGGVA